MRGTSGASAGSGLEVLAVGGDVVAVGAAAAAPAAAGGFAFLAGDDPLDDQGALELGEDAEHLHHHPPGRSAGVERLGRRAEDDVAGGELVDDLREPADRAGEPVDAVDEQQVETAELRITQEAGERRPLEDRAGELVLVAALDSPARLAVHESRQPMRLRLERVRLALLVGGDARVGRDPHRRRRSVSVRD